MRKHTSNGAKTVVISLLTAILAFSLGSQAAVANEPSPEPSPTETSASPTPTPTPTPTAAIAPSAQPGPVASKGKPTPTPTPTPVPTPIPEPSVTIPPIEVTPEMIAAQNALTEALTQVTLTQVAFEEAKKQTVVANAAAETAEKEAAAARLEIDRFARQLYISGGSPNGWSSTVEAIIEPENLSQKVTNAVTYDNAAEVKQTSLETARFKVDAATIAVTKAVESEKAAVAALQASATALVNAQKIAAKYPMVQAAQGMVVGAYEPFIATMENLIGAYTMDWWDGTEGSVDGMCLKNVESAWTMVGGSNENGMRYSAAIAGEAYKKDGLLHPYVSGQIVPRGMLIFWNSSIGRGNGHVAVSDGKGNMVNNWGSDTIQRNPIGAEYAIIGWGPPTVFGPLKNS